MFEFDEEQPYNDNFDQMGYSNINIIQNLGSLFLYMLLYFPLCLLLLLVKLIKMKVAL